MNINLKNKILIPIFLLIAFFLTVSFIGIENFSFNKLNWIMGSGDISNSQNAWTLLLDNY